MEPRLEQFADLIPLIDAIADGRATPDMVLALSNKLCTPEARHFYLDYLAVHHELGWHDDVPAAILTDEPSDDVDDPSTTYRFPLKPIIAAAAAILLAVGLYFAFLPSTPQSTLPDSHSDPSSVAMISDLSGDAQFANATYALGAELPPGEISLISGRAQMMFSSTAVVDLSGPCRFEMIGPNRGQLTEGILEAYVPAAAHGFTIDLPSGVQIVDLGTRFEVIVGRDGGPTLMRVIEGRVAVNRRRAPEQVLTPGELWRIDADGAIRQSAPRPIVTDEGAATPFDVRLPGSGARLGQVDPHLTMGPRGLLMHSTMSDLRGATNLDEGQYPGIDLRRLGEEAGDANVHIEAVFDQLPKATRDFDGYGLFVGTSTNAVIRTGVLHWDRRRAFSVATVDGGDVDLADVPEDRIAINADGELVVSLERTAGVWTAHVGGAALKVNSNAIANVAANAPIVAGVFVNHTDPGPDSGFTVRLKRFTVRVGIQEMTWSSSKTTDSTEKE
ncbi:MAG: hypothetical protein GC162_11445 [Planctomycetes bacterium]|nr:hypothetical protein [Planctomycetota bacterium]